MPDEVQDILVPCPCCGKLHKVPVKDIKENKSVKVDCGAVLGTIGLKRRVEDVEKKVKDFQGRLYKLDK
jgi:hypothetical protein